jgi:hypothetical protein
MYMHPYDATEYHDLENAGPVFRERIEELLTEEVDFVTAAGVRERVRSEHDRIG